MKRWLVWTPLAALALLAVLFVGYALKHNPHYVPDKLVGKPVPAVALPTLEGGGPTPLKATLQGPTFVNVFASWCVPCVQEAPVLAEMKSSGARIVGIATRDDPADTRVFLEKYGNPFEAILVDRDGRASIELGASGYPETYLIDDKGVIVAKYAEGPLTMEIANGMLAKLQTQNR
jgi:cytochrome c biogenesis protein CcmG/thiol:disulfide interchange protein DsbE